MIFAAEGRRNTDASAEPPAGAGCVSNSLPADLFVSGAWSSRLSRRPLKFITLLHASRRPRSVLVRAFSQHLRYDELAQARGQEIYEALNTSQGGPHGAAQHRQPDPGERIYLGPDLSGVNDLCALVGVSAEFGGDRVGAWHWKPQEWLLHNHLRV